MNPKVLLRFLFGGPVLINWTAEVGLLLLRIWGGLALALGHGFWKLPVRPQFIQAVSDAGFVFPTLSAWIAALGEFVGGLLLALGLFTRPAALWIAAVMGGAAFVVHAASFGGFRSIFQPAPGAAEPALGYFFIAVCFLLVGSSRTGLDQLIWRRYILSAPEAELASFERRRDALARATTRE